MSCVQLALPELLEIIVLRPTTPTAVSGDVEQ
jgi:hypothetical protein